MSSPNLRKKMSIKKLIHDPLIGHIVFANYDNVLNIPAMTDGLKDSQRKALFGIYSDNKTKRVSQHASRATELTLYEHGEQSMYDTIAKMGAAYNSAPASNNLPLIIKDGQFGTMLSSESSSPRYISTKLHQNFDRIFNKHDIAISERRIVDNIQTEFVTFIPTLPLLLVNGCSIGIGTGFSSKVFSYDPSSLTSLIKKYLEGKKLGRNKLKPKFFDFKGKVTRKGNTATIIGKYEKVNPTTIRVTELPPTYDSDGYKKVLATLQEEDKIVDFFDNSTEFKWSWDVVFKRGQIGSYTEDEMLSTLGLVRTLTEYIWAWDDKGAIINYKSPEELLEAWVDWKLKTLIVRKEYMVSTLNKDIEWETNKKDFINFWNSAKNPHKMSEDQIAKALGHKPGDEVINKLLSLPIRSLTLTNVKKLEASIKEMKTELVKTKKLKAPEMLIADL